MSQLYTVSLDRIQIKCGYDEMGRRTGERTELIEAVYHDLPHSTALNYQRQFPDANVKITAQEGSSPVSHERPAHDFKRTAPVSIAAPKIDKRLAAATSGSLGEAL